MKAGSGTLAPDARSLACRSRSRLRMFSTCSTPRVYFSMYVSPSEVPSLSLLAASRASVSRSSISSVAFGDRKKREKGLCFHPEREEQLHYEPGVGCTNFTFGMLDTIS